MRGVSGFLRLHPLTLLQGFDPERFGFGEPARAKGEAGPGSAEFVVAVSAIRRFEECPLYWVTPESDNTLIDGVRIELDDGRLLVVADDAADPALRFVAVLDRLTRAGGVAELPPSRLRRVLRRRPAIDGHVSQVYAAGAACADRAAAAEGDD